MPHNTSSMHGRGTGDNPANRFTALSYERSQEWNEPDDPPPQTQFLKDTSRSIIARNDSPDVGFEFSINPYRGCEPGWICCRN